MEAIDRLKSLAQDIMHRLSDPSLRSALKPVSSDIVESKCCMINILNWVDYLKYSLGKSNADSCQVAVVPWRKAVDEIDAGIACDDLVIVIGASS